MTGVTATKAQVRDASPTPRTVKLGSGVTAPYPEPRSEAARRFARGNRRSDTKPEVRLRSELHRKGLRFRKNMLIRTRSIAVRPDVVFTRQRLCIFVDGCFWHGCPDHQRVPRNNTAYWQPKLASNVARDRRVDAALRSDNWTVVRIWEHEAVSGAVERVTHALAARERT
jgi:DNA mismatch endonuclease (patch repair protein)